MNGREVWASVARRPAGPETPPPDWQHHGRTRSGGRGLTESSGAPEPVKAFVDEWSRWLLGHLSSLLAPTCPLCVQPGGGYLLGLQFRASGSSPGLWERKCKRAGGRKKGSLTLQQPAGLQELQATHLGAAAPRRGQALPPLVVPWGIGLPGSWRGCSRVPGDRRQKLSLSSSCLPAPPAVYGPWGPSNEGWRGEGG